MSFLAINLIFYKLLELLRSKATVRLKVATAVPVRGTPAIAPTHPKPLLIFFLTSDVRELYTLNYTRRIN